MRNSPFHDFRKIWGRIDTKLTKGTYKVKVKALWNTKSFEGEKYIVLSQANLLGGQNYFLGYSYLIVGGISLICAIAFIIRKIKRPKGVLDDVVNQPTK